MMSSSGQSSNHNNTSIPQPAHSGNSSSSHRKLNVNDGRNAKRPYSSITNEPVLPSSAHNQQGIKKPRVRDYIGHRGSSSRLAPAILGLSSGHSSHYDAGDNNMPLPLVKPRASEHMRFDKPKEDLSKASAPSDDCDAPLNLCVVKRPSASATASSSAPVAHTKNNSSHNSNIVHKSSSSSAAAAHSSLVESLAQQHERLLALAESFPKKRGRKPKSLLAPNSSNSHSIGNVPVIIVPNSNDGKIQRKRGRPPLMSPPPNVGFTRGDLPNFGLEGLQMISNRLAAAAGAVPSTQLQPGWPSFGPTGELLTFPNRSSTGQIIFPSSAKNGNSSKLSVPGHVRDSISRSSSEVKPSDTSETDDESEASRADERETINEENLRIPLRYG